MGVDEVEEDQNEPLPHTQQLDDIHHHPLCRTQPEFFHQAAGPCTVPRSYSLSSSQSESDHRQSSRRVRNRQSRSWWELIVHHLMVKGGMGHALENDDDDDHMAKDYDDKGLEKDGEVLEKDGMMPERDDKELV